MTLWTDRDIQRVLIDDPVYSGCDELRVLSGYASPHVAYGLLSNPHARSIQVGITVGMVVADGISLGAHRGFLALQNVDYHGRVRVGYIVQGKPVHAKLFVWCRNGTPVNAYAGSANCTANGLYGGYREVLVPADPVASFDFIRQAEADAVPCDDSRVPRELVVLNDKAHYRLRGIVPQHRPWEGAITETVDISLLNSRTDTGVAYGLNWGQRTGRDPDQSYLPIPARVARAGILPPRGTRFTLLADDGQALSVVVAQDGNKAIETPDSNAIMGRFIRAQLGLPAGVKIRAADLLRVRKSCYRLYKIDEETFAIEFGDFER